MVGRCGTLLSSSWRHFQKTMKVLVISAILPPYNRGGAESVAYAAAKAFPEHEVFAISVEPFLSWHSIFGHWDKIHGHDGRSIKVFRFTPLNFFSIFYIARHNALVRLFWHGLDMFNVHTYFMVRRVLRREKPDLILTHNLKGLGYTVPLAIRHSASGEYHPRWFHTIHDMGALHPTGLKIYGEENSFMQTMPLVRLYARLNAWLFGSPDVVISPSEFLLAEYKGKGFFKKSKTAIIRNPVIPNESTSAIKQSPPPFRYLYLGQLEAYKGIKLLLDAWKTFASKYNDAELIIAGEGSLKIEVEQAVRTLPNVRYVGFLHPEERNRILSSVHYLILPSFAYENSPTSIGESLTAGVPVIASKIGGIPELVKDGVNGFLFQPADQTSLLEALERAMAVDYEILRNEALLSASNFSLAKYRASIELQNNFERYKFIQNRPKNKAKTRFLPLSP